MSRSTDDLLPCRGYRLGIVEYTEALDLQNRLARARLREEIADTLLLLQHPPVITLGNSGKTENVLAPRTLCEKNIPVIRTDRGGDVTYHGPGQLVVYPILNLQAHGLGVTGYVWNLEEVVIRVLARCGIAACRVEKLRGVWVGGEKICSLGVHLSNWISRHGLALNVTNDLAPFGLINPCGIGRPMTSVAKILGQAPDMEEVESLMLEAFAEVFRCSLREEPSGGLESFR
jgi:lipoyl(octanoyl) transferase